MLGGMVSLFCIQCIGRAGCTTKLTALYRRHLSKRRLSFYIYRAAPIVGCVILPQLHHLAAAVRWNTPQRDEPNHKQNSAVRSRSTPAYG